jgi:hypothetical protein
LCKGKAHKPEHLGIAGRRVLVSRKWSNKSLDDHRAERAAFVRQLLDHAGVRPGYAVDDGPFEWERTRPGDPDLPTPPDPSCSYKPSASGSAGKPTTPPPNSPPANHPTPARQLAIKQPEGVTMRPDTARIDPLWTAADTAHYLGVPIKTLYQWKWRGQGPPVRKLGRYLRYDPDEVRRWFAALGSDVA